MPGAAPPGGKQLAEDHCSKNRGRTDLVWPPPSTASTLHFMTRMLGLGLHEERECPAPVAAPIDARLPPVFTVSGAREQPSQEE